MILNYGGYAHEDNGVSFTLTGQRVYDKYGRKRRFRVRYVVTGTITGSTQSEITTKCNSLEEAHAKQGGDLVFTDNNGAETAHVLRSAQCLGGTRSHGPDYLDGYPGIWGSSTEYVEKRTYRVVIEGDVADRGGLVSWTESWTQIGTAGPEYKWVESLLGDPVKQRLKLKTTTLGIQSGSSIGDDAYPPIPAAMSQEYLMNIKGQSPRVQLWTPDFFIGGGTANFKASWFYIHEAPFIMAQAPTWSP